MPCTVEPEQRQGVTDPQPAGASDGRAHADSDYDAEAWWVVVAGESARLPGQRLPDLNSRVSPPKDCCPCCRAVPTHSSPATAGQAGRGARGGEGGGACRTLPKQYHAHTCAHADALVQGTGQEDPCRQARGEERAERVAGGVVSCGLRKGEGGARGWRLAAGVREVWGAGRAGTRSPNQRRCVAPDLAGASVWIAVRYARLHTCPVVSCVHPDVGGFAVCMCPDPSAHAPQGSWQHAL